jgi:uracil-DNA glycosylase family 4
MPFGRSDHFIALEASIGQRISNGQDIFLQNQDKVDFCTSAEDILKDNPNPKISHPDPSDSNTYIVSDPCKECNLWSVSHAAANGVSIWRSGVYGRGTGKNGIYIVGEALGAFEVVNGKPFCGAAGVILSRALEKVGIVEEDCFTCNTTRCRPEGNRNPKAAEVKACQDAHFEKDLPYGSRDKNTEHFLFDPNWRPKLIIVLGAVALKYMMKMPKITENRGIFFDTTFIDTPVKFIATWHPAKILLSPEMLSDFEEDLVKAKRFITGEDSGGVPPIAPAYISTKDNFLQWMNFLIDLPEDVDLSVDIEATGLNYLTDEIASIAITLNYNNKSYGIAFLTCLKEGWWNLDINNHDSVEFNALKYVLENHHLTFQGGDFDVKFFWKHGINVINWFDTIDAHGLISERGPHNLAYMVKRYLGESAGYKEKFRDSLGDKTAYHKAPAKDLLEYNFDDTYYTQLLRDIFTRRMGEEDVSDLFWTHSMPLQRTLSRMSYRGVRVDRSVLMELASENRSQIKERLKLLYEEVGEINIASPQAVSNLLYNKLKLPIIKYTDKGSPSTDKDALETLGLRHHIPRLIHEIRTLAKQNSTYLDGDTGLTRTGYQKNTQRGLLPFLDNNDRVHTHFRPWGTISGRLSASSPNLLNIPKESQFRQMFIPSDGCVFINADYAQAELLVLAYLCQDPNLINDVNSSDLHSKVVIGLMGISPDDPNFSTQRKIAKNINFGKVYGAGPKKLVEQLKYSAKIDITLEEAKMYHSKWDMMYPGVSKWVFEQQNKWREDKEIVSIFGRKLRFPDLTHLRTIPGQNDNFNEQESKRDRIAINFPPQSAVGDVTNRSLYFIDDALEKIYGKWEPKTCMEGPAPILSVHDEVLIETPEDITEKIAKLVYEIMIIPLPVLNIPLKVEMELKSSWGDKEGKSVAF